MNCPYCSNEMEKGILSGDGRSRVYWKAGEKKAGFSDKIYGEGVLTNVRYSLATFEIDSYYCNSCKKMIFDTEIGG